MLRSGSPECARRRNRRGMNYSPDARRTDGVSCCSRGEAREAPGDRFPAGVGQGLGFRAALAGITAATPAERRAGVVSSFFVVAYVAISLPVIGEGLMAEVAGLKTAGLVFVAIVAALAAVALGLLVRERVGSAAAAPGAPS